MGIVRNLLINGSLVRAQQAEPIYQGLTAAKDGRLVLNLEPGSKPILEFLSVRRTTGAVFLTILPQRLALAGPQRFGGFLRSSQSNAPRSSPG